MDYSFDKITVTQLMYRVAVHLKNIEQVDSGTKKQLSELVDSYEPDSQKCVSFSLISKLYHCLLEFPIAGETISLHDLLRGTQIIFPSYEPPERNPELVARLEKIKARLAHQEYNKMVHNLHTPKVGIRDAGLEVRSVYKQLGVFINMLFTVIGCFAFGYFATYYSSYRPEMCILAGATLAFIVFVAEIYFIATR